MATGESFSRVEILNGNPDGGVAPALHIASGEVQNTLHHMGIPEWLRPYFCLWFLSARAFGMTGKNVQGSLCLRGANTVSCHYVGLWR